MKVCDRCHTSGVVAEAIAQINFDGIEIEETMDVCDECYQAVRDLLVTPSQRRRKKRPLLSLTGKED